MTCCFRFLGKEAFSLIFLYAGGVYPSRLAPCKAVYMRYKDAGVWVRRTHLLLAWEYGGCKCPCHCRICCSKRGIWWDPCVRPKGHTGRCVCFHCWSQGVEHWFRGLRLCSMCHSAIRGVLVKSLPYGPMHWGCYRYRKPPSHSFELLPEYHSSVAR